MASIASAVLIIGRTIARSSIAEQGFGGMPGKIFINYRRGDDAGFTQALYLRLEDEFAADNLPVINVSWDDAKQYTTWLFWKTGKSYRLLSEAEFEYAARAGTTTKYSWGDEIGKGNANCVGCGSEWDGKQTAPVGSFKPNALGLYGMHGNVWQWVEDTSHANYQGAPTDGSPWTSGDTSFRILRGGSFASGPNDISSAVRFGYSRGLHYMHIGFRVARTL